MGETLGDKAIRLWPPIAVAAMLVLGWAVRKGSTPVDDWFHQYGRGPARHLLVFTDPRVLAILVAGTLVVAIYQRRWRFAAVAVASPLVAMALPQLLKRLIGRESGSALAYPSGHTTTMVVVLGMVVLAAEAALWAVLVTIAFGLLGMLGQGITFHYFTDTVGGVLLGTAIVCVAALTLGPAAPPNLTRVNPACDLRHSES
jgi:membrane-associated phospholipid phosphatase